MCLVTDPPVDRTMQLGTPRQALSSPALMPPNLWTSPQLENEFVFVNVDDLVWFRQIWNFLYLTTEYSFQKIVKKFRCKHWLHYIYWNIIIDWIKSMESSTHWLAGETKGRQIPSAEGGGPAREICQISILYEKKYFCQWCWCWAKKPVKGRQEQLDIL